MRFANWRRYAPSFASLDSPWWGPDTTDGKAKKETDSSAKEGKKKSQAGAIEKIHVGLYKWEASPDKPPLNDRRYGSRQLCQTKRGSNMVASK